MGAAIGLLTIGGILIAASLKGLSLPELLAGATGNILDPKGGSTTAATDAAAAGNATPTDPTPTGSPTGSTPLPGGDTGGYKGPRAAWLKAMETIAVKQFHLTPGQLCRPANATYGAPNSLHKSCRARDYGGSVANRVAFARFAKARAQTDGVDAEVFCDQAGMVAPGYDHSDHVHLGA